MDTHTILGILMFLVGGIALMQSWILGRLDAIAEKIREINETIKRL